MQAASQKYKESVRQSLRQWSHIKVTIGMINQDAQASAKIPDTLNYTYYSNLKNPLDNYDVKELYATCDRDYTAVDAGMYFLPRNAEDVILNTGIVSKSLFGTIEVKLPVPHDIKGLTIEFGKSYPINFTVQSDNRRVEISGNNSGHFVTEEVFTNTTFIRLIPLKMINGQSRFRVHKLTMGIGIYFDGRNTLLAVKKEHISPISEELQTIDFQLNADNKNRIYDIENEESSMNFLEVGQNVEVIYGYELEPGAVEWIQGAKLSLKEWSADDEEVSFSASDRFDYMDGEFYKGNYHEEGISLYSLAVEVLLDAGVDSREYWLDPYLKNVKTVNPVPVVSHKEALQMIANAGRCILYQDRMGNIIMKSGFIPYMTVDSENDTYFSNTRNILNAKIKLSYGISGKDYTGVDTIQWFLPKESAEVFGETGYVSEETADSKGVFANNPTVTIALEASFKCFGLTLEFGRNPPQKMVIHSYFSGLLLESYYVASLEKISIINHEFPEFDYLVLEFTEGMPNNRVVLNNVLFGDSTDYALEYGKELTKTPKGTQLQKVRELQVIKTMYSANEELKELLKETVPARTGTKHTCFFTNPSYDLTCTVAGSQHAKIVEYSTFYAVVEIEGENEAVEIVINGREYIITQSRIAKQLNQVGSIKTWENPLISGEKHASNIADWVGEYMLSDRDYDLSYRGEPRIDANDIAFLENKYIPDMIVRVYDHTLKFNGALSGTIKARRDMGYVATAKNRLEGKRFLQY